MSSKLTYMTPARYCFCYKWMNNIATVKMSWKNIREKKIKTLVSNKKAFRQYVSFIRLNEKIKIRFS